MAASAELDGFEAGVAAFHRGDFIEAKLIIADYTYTKGLTAMAYTKGLTAMAYLFAMQDKKNPDIAPSEELKAFIVAQVDVDPLYKALSAKLHLMGYHVASNPGVGLSDLVTLGNGNAYALYTLGLYYEGVFTVPPSPANLIEAKLKYTEARAIGHRAAMKRYTIVEQLLNPEPEGAWKGEDDRLSQQGDGLVDILSWDPRSTEQRLGRSVATSILSCQTSGRFYGGASVVSAVSADSEAPQRVSLAPKRSPPPRAASAAGHEALQRFMDGRLEYRPTPGSDVGMITLLFRDLLAPLVGAANPLSATFDLSRCGDAGNYLSINIGYKKRKIPANAGKTEIWICPKFLVEEELATTASYLAPIMGQWEFPVGYFWTWGNYDVATDNYQYLLNGIIDQDNSLYGKYASTSTFSGLISYFMAPGLQNFLIY
jgi:hypothetical protein